MNLNKCPQYYRKREHIVSSAWQSNLQVILVKLIVEGEVMLVGSALRFQATGT
jgi:hypothetical protein